MNYGRGLWLTIVLACLLALGLSAVVHAGGASSRGQVLYVPVYSEIPYGDRGDTLNLTATVSIRNTDRKASITVKRVDYYNSKGALVRAHLSAPLTLGPLASSEHIIKESDRSGGIGASFIVEWVAEGAVSPAMVESIMISTLSTQGISFLSSARVLEERR